MIFNCYIYLSIPGQPGYIANGTGFRCQVSGKQVKRFRLAIFERKTAETLQTLISELQTLTPET